MWLSMPVMRSLIPAGDSWEGREWAVAAEDDRFCLPDREWEHVVDGSCRRLESVGAAGLVADRRCPQTARRPVLERPMCWCSLSASSGMSRSAEWAGGESPAPRLARLGCRSFGGLIG